MIFSELHLIFTSISMQRPHSCGLDRFLFVNTQPQGLFGDYQPRYHAVVFQGAV